MLNTHVSSTFQHQAWSNAINQVASRSGLKGQTNRKLGLAMSESLKRLSDSFPAPTADGRRRSLVTLLKRTHRYKLQKHHNL